MPSPMTAQQLRDYVRNFLDTDAEEVPDVLLDVWMNEGVARIQRTIPSWSFFETSWSVTTDEAEIPFAQFDPSVDSVTSVEGPDWMLRYLPHAQAVAKYAWGDVTGVAYEFSVSRTEGQGPFLRLWPTPSASATYVVRGYRVAADVVAATDSPDLPEEIHPLVAEWMLARAFEQQDDLQMSVQKQQMFERQLDVFRRQYMRAMTPDVQQIGGGAGLQLSGRLRFPWE